MFQTNCECILFLSTMSRLQYFKNYFLLETTSAKNCLEQYCQGFYNNHCQCHCCCYFHNQYIVPLSSLIASSIALPLLLLLALLSPLLFLLSFNHCHFQCHWQCLFYFCFCCHHNFFASANANFCTICLPLP